MLRMYLFIGEALLCEDLKQWGSIAVSSLEHLSHYGQKVPDAFWLSTPQRSQQTCPFGSGWWLRGRQVHRVYITVDNTHSTDFSQVRLRYIKQKKEEVKVKE